MFGCAASAPITSESRSWPAVTTGKLYTIVGIGDASATCAGRDERRRQSAEEVKQVLQSICTDLTMESQHILLRHRRDPRRRREDERVARAGLLGVRAELLRLARALRAGARDDERVSEAVRIECLAREADRILPLVVREVLRLAVGALDEDARHARLE
jgi:hypothetical protein